MCRCLSPDVRRLIDFDIIFLEGVGLGAAGAAGAGCRWLPLVVDLIMINCVAAGVDVNFHRIVDNESEGFDASVGQSAPKTLSENKHTYIQPDG